MRDGDAQPFSVHGEVVEILEREGARAARMRIDARTVLELTTDGLPDLHLGDRLSVEGKLLIEGIERLPEATKSPVVTPSKGARERKREQH